MSRLSTFVWFCVTLLCVNAPSYPAQISMQELAEIFRTGSDAEPIRVLTVTATHGFRHTPAINTTKRLLGALNETTEFTFDFTEDVNDFNRANLERYDLLFFANSTLRVDEPTEDAVGYEAELKYQPGDWRNYDAVLKTDERDIKGRIALSGKPGELSGMADFGAGVSVISTIEEQGDELRLIWDAASSGTVTAEVTLTDDGLSGYLKVGEQSLVLEGVAVDAPQQADLDVKNPVTAEHRAAIMEFLSNGGGIVGAHSALDAFYGWGEYRQMVGGGLFEAHPWTQRVRILIEDPENPAVAHMGDELMIRDEIYVLDNNPRWNSHVLASLDMSSVGVEQGPA
ncbi:MAG: ThuA domain-containing protein, partial [Pseudomonadales bacterium]